MTFEERIAGPMKRLAHKLVDLDLFSGLENICNFMVAVKSGRWQMLPADEQKHWLTQLDGLLGLRALGDHEELYGDPDMAECQKTISAALKAVERRI